MAWVVDGRTFARKVKNPTHGISRHASTENQLECPSCGHEIDKSEIMPEWPGLPSGVKFDPSDQEILEHLAAQVGIYTTKPHPFINEFIPTLEVEDGICYTHPEKLPGIRRDGNCTHFFHRPTRAYTTGTRKRRKVQSSEDEGEIRWHKTGKTRPVVESGRQLGCKKIMVLYVSFGKKTKPDKTNWVMHQYHLGVQEEEREGELVVSKVFYQTQPRQSVLIGKDNVDEIEQVVLELTGEPSNDSSGVSSMPKTPAPINSQQVAHHKGLLETLSEDVNRLQASLSFEKRTAASPEATQERELPGEANVNSEQVQVIRQDQLVNAAEDGLPKEDHIPSLGSQPFSSSFDADLKEDGLPKEDHIPSLGSQPFSSSFDADLLKLLCNENLKALSQGDGSSDWNSVAAEVCSKLESQDALSLDKIVLGTPPDLLEFLLNSQGSTVDWAEKLKLWTDSQKTEDFNLADFLQNSQSLQ